VALDGVIVVSDSCAEPPYRYLWEEQDASELQDYLFQMAIRQITDLITCHGLVALDFTDVMMTISGGVIQLGVGVASGDGRSVTAAEKATTCLIKQGVEMQVVTGMLNSIRGSATMSNDDYNSFTKYIHEQCNDECVTQAGVILNNSLGDSVMTGIVAVHEVPEELPFLRWARLYNKYSLYRRSEPSVPLNIKDDREIPPWLQK
jgi:cell division GTPase FtsZ